MKRKTAEMPVAEEINDEMPEQQAEDATSTGLFGYFFGTDKKSNTNKVQEQELVTIANPMASNNNTDFAIIDPKNPPNGTKFHSRSYYICPF